MLAMSLRRHVRGLLPGKSQTKREVKGKKQYACQSCRDQIPGERSEIEPCMFPLSRLNRSHKKGCRVCSLLFRGLFALEPTAARNMVTEVAIHFLQGYVDLRYWTFFTYLGSIFFYSEWDSTPPWKCLKPSPIRAKHFGSDECLSQIKRWTDDCEQNHTHPCCKRPAAAVLPTRIIDLGTLGHPKMRLVESKGMIAKYMALSHCWGKGRHFVTTATNLQRMKEGFLVEELPLTFRDAVKVARFLQIRYLWIDSICILQGDQKDWEREAAKMSTVYSNAYITLGASSCSNDADGFLHERPEKYYGKVLCSKLDRKEVLDIRVREKILHEIPARDVGLKPSGVEPLERRAWTLQEDVLSRRFLSFESGELAWECAQRLTCECGGKARYGSYEDIITGPKNTEISGDGEESDILDISKDRKSSSADIGKNFIEGDQTQDLPQHPLGNNGRLDKVYIKPLTTKMDRKQLYEIWLVICVQYSGRQLTQAGDKMPALSGLADRFRHLIGDTYLAGLWRNNLLPGLLWVVNERLRGRFYKMQSSLPMSWRSPSWSWASIDGSITYSDYRIHGISTRSSRWHVSVQDSECKLAGPSATGCISQASLRLKGHRVRAVFGHEGEVIEFKHIRATHVPSLSKQFFQSIDVRPDVPFTEEKSEDQANGVGNRPPHLRSHSEVMDFTKITMPVDCLLLVDGELPREPSRMLYLLMLGSSSRTPGAYERLGLIACNFIEFDNSKGGRVDVTDWFIHAPTEELTVV